MIAVTAGGFAVLFADVLDILYEDNHLLGLNKPAGWPSAHFDGTDQTMDLVAKAYLKEKYKKPGNVFLGVVHRLDKSTSGCLLFARTSKGAARISEQLREGAVEKVYYAVVEAGPKPWPDAGTLEDWLLHDDDQQRVRVVPEGTFNAKHSRMHYALKASHGNRRLLELRPLTGRKHQLRVQLASRGCPIVGDNKYGSPHRLGNAIALHARSLTFLHPTTTEPITLTADVPRNWHGPFAYLLAGMSHDRR